jgi:homoserine O-acetyltransferase
MQKSSGGGADGELVRHDIGDFELDSGVLMPSVTIAYRALGTLAPDGRNAVLVTHGYTSGPQMIEPRGAGGPVAEGGWQALVGPGKPIDTDRYFVLCPNMLGSSYGSTNAASIEPASGRRYGSRFPELTVTDIVRSQRRLLDDLGVKHLMAVVGPSYGGYQAFQWAVDYPDFMHGIVPAVTSPKASATAGNALAELERDPNWNGGDYYDCGGVQETLVRLRIATLKHYGIEARLRESLGDQDEREAAIRRMATAWAEQFDANSLVILRRALRSYDTEPSFSRIKARVLYVLSRTDRLFPPSLAPGVMQGLRQAGVDADYFEIDSEHGHHASGVDAEKWAPRLRMFMQTLDEDEARATAS